MKLSQHASLAACALTACLGAQAGNVSGHPSAGAPQIFAPGVISGASNDADAAFTPGAGRVVFSRDGAVMVSMRSGKGWSAPRIAPFSGQWMDTQPTMSPDGSYLVFVSNRPIVAGDAKHPRGNLWRVDLHGASWGKPVHLPATVNRDESIWGPSISGDGSLYFMARADAKAPFRLWRSQAHNGAYLEAQPLSFGDSTTQDVDPAVAPDESFIVFSSKHPAQDAHERLYIAFKGNAEWGPPIDLGDAINGNGGNDCNEARLGPDGRTLYFSTDRTLPVAYPRTRRQATDDLRRIAAWDNGNHNIWSVSLAPWLDAARSK